MMPNIIRTVTRSTIIAQYLKYCSDEDFSPLSRATLYRILCVREASQRTSLKGLDNTAADGSEAFETVLKVVDELQRAGAPKEWSEETRKELRDGKRYLKTTYRDHCKPQSQCADHCRDYALSDPTDNDLRQACDHCHGEICNSCESVKNIFESIEIKIEEMAPNFYTSEQKEDLLYDFKQAKEHVFTWKAHILRSANQEASKQHVLDNLDVKSVLILVDWAMKFLQIKYREKQSDWFGKRGLNWHISSVVSKTESGSTEVLTYAHLFDSCTQDWFAVASVIEHLLSCIKKEQPSIERVFLRSDEAGCYHNHQLIAAMQGIAQKHGVIVERYDFSEPQQGKDMCDRILCPMKAAIKRYCNEGHDIRTASDMRKALHERPVRGTTAAVGHIDQSRKEIVVKKIPGFSSYHNFGFEENGIRVSKAFGVGRGKLILYGNITTKPQGPTSLVTEKDKGFFPPVLRRELHQKSKEIAETDDGVVQYECPEVACTRSFSRLQDLEAHEDVGVHSVASSESIFDSLKRDWVKKFATISLEKKKDVLETRCESSTQPIAAHCPMGWALHKPRPTPTRYSPQVRQYLNDCFDLGEKTGHKADPQQVATDMRNARNESGDRMFQRQEWLNKAQVQGFFSRLAASRRRPKTADDDVGDEETEQCSEDALAQELMEREQCVLKSVIQELSLKHPIEYGSFNLCEYYRTNKLKSFSVKVLKEMCSHFDISFKSRDKKADLVAKIEHELKACSCFKA